MKFFSTQYTNAGLPLIFKVAREMDKGAKLYLSSIVLFV